VYRQFLAALGDAPLLDADGTLAKDVLLVYHGTRSVKNAKRIMCEGFDPMKRKGQSFGAGEYFADTLGTSLEYAQTTGAIMLCAVFIRAEDVSRKWTDAAEDYYTIVDTPMDRTAAYALPLVVLPRKTKTPVTRCRRCTRGATFNQYVRFRNDGGRWQRMSAQELPRCVDQSPRSTCCNERLRVCVRSHGDDADQHQHGQGAIDPFRHRVISERDRQPVAIALWDRSVGDPHSCY
jgi:hypothetical protein